MCFSFLPRACAKLVCFQHPRHVNKNVSPLCGTMSVIFSPVRETIQMLSKNVLDLQFVHQDVPKLRILSGIIYIFYGESSGATNSQTKDPKRNYPSESSQGKDPERKFPSERSQAVIVKRELQDDSSKEKYQSEGF